MKKLLLVWILVLLVLPAIDATDSSYVFKQNEAADMTLPCIDALNNYCDAGTNCILTVKFPNGTILVDGGTMTRQTTYFNYTIGANSTSDSGVYTSAIQCAGASSGMSTFSFEVTPSGRDLSISTGWSTALMIMIVTLIIVFTTLFIALHEHTALRIFFFGMDIGMMLLGVNISKGILIANQDNIDATTYTMLFNSFNTTYNVMIWVFWVVMAYLVLYFLFKIIGYAGKMVTEKKVREEEGEE